MSGFVLPRSVTQRSRGVSGRAAAGWLEWLASALRTIETRRYLAQMDDRMLKDVGISRSEALEEAARAPWDIETQQRRAPFGIR